MALQVEWRNEPSSPRLPLRVGGLKRELPHVHLIGVRVRVRGRIRVGVRLRLRLRIRARVLNASWRM